MRFTVAWTEPSLDHLALVWMSAADRNAVSRAVDEIDAELSVDPGEKGDDYFGDRFITHPLMWVLYRVYPEPAIVSVLQVGRPGIDLPHDHQPI